MDIEINVFDFTPKSQQEHFCNNFSQVFPLFSAEQQLRNSASTQVNASLQHSLTIESVTNCAQKDPNKNQEKQEPPNYCITDICNIVVNCSQYSEMRLFGDLSVSADGILRLCSVFSNVNLGYFPSDCDQVSFLKSSQIFNLRFLPLKSIQKHPTLDALKLVAQLPDTDAVAVQNVLQNVDKKEKSIKKQITEMNVSEQLIQEKNQQFEAFNDFCFNYLNTYYGHSIMEGQDQSSSQYIQEPDQGNSNKVASKHHLSTSTRNTEFTQDSMPGGCLCSCWQGADILEVNKCYAEHSQMFTYAIGRIDLEKQDIDIHNAGYSAGFLELLGLDQDSLATIQLRRKKIDLIPDKREIIRQSIHGIKQRSTSTYDYNFSISEANIVTFDGFPMKIYKKTLKMDVPEQFKSYIQQRQEYLFVMNVIDVDLDQLQDLIAYRQNINSNKNNIKQNIDAFIQKELSYRFEDVEYSIHSEHFLSEFYSENLKALRQIEKLKYPCKYRIIVK